MLTKAAAKRKANKTIKDFFIDSHPFRVLIPQRWFASISINNLLMVVCACTSSECIKRLVEVHS
jgi:hypothetical protein